MQQSSAILIANKFSNTLTPEFNNQFLPNFWLIQKLHYFNPFFDNYLKLKKEPKEKRFNQTNATI